MAATDQLSRLAPYARRLLDDDAVQSQLDRGYANLRSGTKRVRGKGARQAVGDRKARRQLGAAVAAATQVVRALREPEPPKRHVGRRLVGLGVIAGGATVAYRRLSDNAA